MQFVTKLTECILQPLVIYSNDDSKYGPKAIMTFKKMSGDFGCLTDIKFLRVNKIKYKCTNLVPKDKEFDLVLAPFYFYLNTY